MKNIDKKQLIITTLIGLVLVAGCLFIFKIHQADSASKVFTSICNSFFVVGGVYICLGLLTWCTNEGAFVGLTYSFHRIFEKRRFEKTFQERPTYAEYREKKLAKQKTFAHFIIPGVCFIVISIIFLLLI